MIKIALAVALAILFFTGCGITKKSDENTTYVQPTNPAYNCLSPIESNGYGTCYSSTALFNGLSLTSGIWSMYVRSNTGVNSTGFYDRYVAGYDFGGDGSAFKQVQTDGYTVYRQWGVDNAGSVVTVSTDGSYTYQATFTGGECFLVTSSTSPQQIRFCHESYVNAGYATNASGYYGAGVTFGNRTNYNYAVTGIWELSGYGENTAAATSVTLDSNGTVAGGGEWGVSGDGKVIEISGTRYLVYQYIENTQCIAVFELAGGLVTPTEWELCKQ